MSVVRAASSSSANRIIQYLANNSSSLYGVDTGLEFGPEMVEAALRAGTWEAIDSSRSEIPTEFKNNGNLSKITEINKTENRIRQRFIVNLDGKYNTNKNIKPAFEIYQEPDTGVYGAHKNNLTYSVKTLKKVQQSTILSF